MKPEDKNQDLEYLQHNVEVLNQIWNIADPPVESHKPLIGGVVTIFKRCIRKATYWMMRSYWDQQREFNRVLAAAVSDIYRLECANGNVAVANVDVDPMETVEGGRVFQLVSSLNFGDAVGNEVIAFKKTLQENGYATEIYTNHIHQKIPAGTARLYKDMPQLRKEDVVIYHFASQCDISRDIKNFPCKVVLRYHNVTPPEFFRGYDRDAEKATINGLRQVKEIRPYIDYCLPVSEFNKHDLQKMGYTCPMEVLPILIRFEDYEQEPDDAVIEKYNDGRKNILFVGRMAPNKKVEDVISCFAYYKEHFDQAARLFLVGSYQEKDKYYQFLQKHIKKLGVKDVIFPGHISFAAILAYYKIADLFLCMSEHEGFCVPLVEAMFFRVPIVAYDSSAVPNTLGKAGLLAEDKNPAHVSEIMEACLQDSDMPEKQKQQLEKFQRDVIAKVLVTNVQKVVKSIK